MNRQITARAATYQDILDAPPTMVAEIIRGALHLQPRPVPRHAQASSALEMELGSPFDRGARWARRMVDPGRAGCT
jgi:hypothetical protein